MTRPGHAGPGAGGVVVNEAFGRVLAMVLGHALRLAAAGVLLGVVGAFAATRMLQSELFEVTPADPVVYLAVCALFTIAAVAGGLAPGVHAARLDQTQSLRSD